MIFQRFVSKMEMLFMAIIVKGLLEPAPKLELIISIGSCRIITFRVKQLIC